METDKDDYEEWFSWKGGLKLVLICAVLSMALLAAGLL